MKKFFLTAVAAASFFAANAQIEMPSLFNDGMVLQQKSQVPIWGKASENEEITVSNTWNSEVKTVKASSDGKWKVVFNTPCYGGPYAITIKGKNTVHINDVFIGEVWVASGQSNMEMPMGGWPGCPVLNGPNDIAESFNNEIRVFMVQRNVSFKEEFDFEGSWKIASPQNTPLFGATCYYFAKKLHDELGIPIGIINTTWGGTPVESWIPEEYVKNIPEHAQKIKDISLSIDKIEERKQWLNKKETFDFYSNPDLGDSKCKDKDFDDSKWHTMNIPQLWEGFSEVRAFDGIVWFRKNIKITPQMAGKELVISLGAIDDADQTYFNGTLIGSETNYQADRVYVVPADKVKEGDAVIAIRVVDNQGGGGLYGDKEKIKYYTKGNEKTSVSLVGAWKYLPVAELSKGKLYKFDISSMEFYSRPNSPVDLGEMTPTCLYNGMIAPIVNYKIAGAIWYQGEANVGHAEEYSRTFPMMIKAWREKWNQGDFPFYYVQIAPFDYGTNGKSEEIREAQRLTLDKTKNTGMVVTMDIGDNTNIHPADKRSVGNRLAFIALNNVYGKKDVIFSGPEFKSQKIEGSKIILTFDNADGLNFKGSGDNGFEICGKNFKYYPAKAEIKGNTVEISSLEVKKPVAVRYLWKDCVNNSQLFNAGGLPTSSFKTDNLKLH